MCEFYLTTWYADQRLSTQNVKKLLYVVCRLQKAKLIIGG